MPQFHDCCDQSPAAGQPDPTLLTAADVAEWLGASADQVHKLARAHQIPHMRINSLVRFDRDEIRRWLGSHRVPMRETDRVTG